MLQHLPRAILTVYTVVGRKSAGSLDFCAKGLAGASSEPCRRFPVVAVCKHSSDSTVSVTVGCVSGIFFFVEQGEHFVL